MAYDANKHHRRSIRLAGYDYSRAGAYFVTVATQQRACLFGDVDDGMRLNDFGQRVVEWWCDIPTHFPSVDIDEYIVMPNHIHGLIVIFDEAAPNSATGRTAQPWAGKSRPTLGQIIAYFKYQSTKQFNIARQTPGASLWQRNYYEHIIRTPAELERVRQYIHTNPSAWTLDSENPAQSNPST